MTISFPGSPSDGQVYTPGAPAPSYVYSSSTGVWNILSTPGLSSPVDTVVDFGTTPTAYAAFTVTDAGVSAASTVFAEVRMSATASNSLDDHRHAAASFSLSTEPASGSFVLNIFCLFDLAIGQFTIRYRY